MIYRKSGFKTTYEYLCSRKKCPRILVVGVLVVGKDAWGDQKKGDFVQK
jgi:hypothetical protein